jgi:tetratricopeptide (TPR) repeat protein
LVKLLSACLLLWTWTVAAIAACPGNAGEPLPPAADLRALDEELVRLAPQCNNDPGYLAYRGAVLNALGKPDEAAAFLEQALLLNPQLAGAQLDYAEALAATGDTSAASALLKDLLARPDVPPDLRAHLVRRLNAFEALHRFDALTGLQAWIGTDWQGTAAISVRVGHDSNLNSAPSRDTLTLTFPGGEAQLLLAERFRARGGMTALAEANGQAARRLDGGAALQFYGEARARVSPSNSDTDYQQGQAAVGWSKPINAGEALLAASVTRLHYGGADLYGSARFSVSRDWSYKDCRPRLGVEAEWRRYPAASELKGQFYGLITGFACLLGSDRLAAAVRAGRDIAQRDRPGGDQRQFDLRIAWLGALGNGTLLADTVVSFQRDQQGFSPLLENNATRRLNRLSVHLEYAYPIASGWAVLVSADGTLQRSNLDLFDISGRTIYLGLRWQTLR